MAINEKNFARKTVNACLIVLGLSLSATAILSGIKGANLDKVKKTLGKPLYEQIIKVEDAAEKKTIAELFEIIDGRMTLIKLHEPNAVQQFSNWAKFKNDQVVAEQKGDSTAAENLKSKYKLFYKGFEQDDEIVKEAYKETKSALNGVIKKGFNLKKYLKLVEEMESEYNDVLNSLR